MRNLPAQIIATYIILFCISCSAQSNDREYSGDITDNPAFGAWQDSETPPFEFELEQTFGDNEEIMFPQIYQLQGPVADSAGNIYLIDGQNGTMYSFDSNGNLRWKKGEEGKGPGDFERPQGLITDGEYLYTGNISGTRIDQFDFDGNLIKTTTLESQDLTFASPQGFISDGLMVITSYLLGKVGRNIFVLNTKDDFNTVSQFEIITAPNLDLGRGMSYGVNIGIIDSLIVAGNVQNYVIPFFNRQGNKLKTITRDFNKLMRPGFVETSSGSALRSYGSLGAPISHPHGFYIVTLSWPTNVDDPDQFLKRSRNEDDDVPDVTYNNSLDFYNTEGRLLYSIEHQNHMPEIGTISYIDENGKVYTKIDEPYPQIRRYNLTVYSPS